ncbi:hypothetical protein A2867_02870 [Candidatus Daviesbacteria bacterium RIFCSPHIGHO2_01_FULL_40_11]|uniref:Uncharacterized protein n=1 Tax=Candidatus Daviesbacteria bacterium RIFCSPHIGHO2_01_FULL_40_11 TaxID=1797762 RepID=A0A1F5JJP9_9BACT|nr:MAG: hypothetical protein A2867_02870 [Candidatus Daviesbacteria bacterium RIFCSPHIGHO2_01_FULL_40_11]
MRGTIQTQHNMDKLTRRNIRYICFRIQTEALGGAKADKEKEGIMQYVDEVKEHMESQDDFGGWDKFAKTWDVDDKTQLVAVTRKSSIQTDWNIILKKEAKELPVEKEKKFLTNKLSEKVQKAKEETQETEAQTPLDEIEIKQVKNDLQEKVQENRKQSEKTSFWDKLK